MTLPGNATTVHLTAEVYVPPINFSMLCSGVYRSGYPTKKNFRFLKALNLRSICYLCPEDYALTNLKFCEENDIQVLRFPMEGNKEPFVDIPEGIVHRVLSALCDTANHPVLIHCNKGKHRTGTICGCLRKVQGWSLVSIFDEYLRFAGDKARVGDQQYMELYRPILRLEPSRAARWIEFSAKQITVVHSDDELAAATATQLEHSLLSPQDKLPQSTDVRGAAGAAGDTEASDAAAAEAKRLKKEAKKAAAAAAASGEASSPAAETGAVAT